MTGRIVQIAIAELVRVLRPGGILLAYDNDWGTFTVTADNAAITSTLEKVWVDSFTNSWIGRELEEHFVKAGLSQVSIYQNESITTDLDTADKVYNLEQTVLQAITSNLISSDEGAEWINELKARTTAGNFAVNLKAYTVVGHNN